MVDSLFPFQEQGADWLAAGGRYLADEQRVGKTPQLVRAADKVGAQTVVITCPATATSVWRRAVERWSYGLWRAEIGSYDRHSDHGLPEGDVYIFDEAHRLKSFAAQRTQKLLGPNSPARRARHTWAASGTPTPNHPGELVPWLTFYGLWTGGYEAFLKRFCRYRANPHGTFTVYGVKKDRAEELRRLIGPLHLRRLRRDVLPFEAEALWDDIILAVDGVLSAERLRPTIALDPDALPDEDDEHMATLRRLVGEAKAGPLADYLADELEDGTGKVAIYFWHEAVGDIIAERLARFGVVRVDGKTPRHDDPAKCKRTMAQDAFNDDPRVRVFLGQILAAGEAIDLAKSCSSLVFAEMSWTPGENSQVAARLSGLLQTERVLIRTATLRGSLDDGLNHVLARKTQTINILYGAH